MAPSFSAMVRAVLCCSMNPMQLPERRRTVLFSTQNFLPGIGGMQVYVTGLADALARRGYQVIVFADGSRESEESDRRRPYPILRFAGPRPWRQRKKAHAIAQQAELEKAWVVVADSWKSVEQLPEAIIAAMPVFCLAHGAELLAERGTLKHQRITASLARATTVAANSQFTANLVRPLLDEKTDLRVVWPAIEPPMGAPSSLSTQPRAAPRRIVSVARLDPYKGIDIVFRAMARLGTRHPDLNYDVIGDGKDRRRLDRLVKVLGIERQVRFHGQVSEARKGELLGEADIFVLCNRRAPGEVEGFGIAFLEAAAFGLPSIGGIDGGTSDAVIAEQTGILVDGADIGAVASALDRLLCDAELRCRLAAAAHNRFWSEFTWDAAIGRFESAFDATR